MSKDERASEAAFLKERWNLIQEGTERKSIKLRNNEIYINNKLHGRLEKSNNGYYTVTRQMDSSHSAVVGSNIPTDTVEDNNNVQMHSTPSPSPLPSKSSITHN